MMISTAQFLQASPALKEAMINDGLQFIAEKMEELERNARVLTGWMTTYPDHVKLGYANLDRPKDLIDSLKEVIRKMDDLTAQLVSASIANELLLRHTREHITRKQLQP